LKKKILGVGVVMATAFIEVRFLKDTAAIVGTDFKTYGPFKKDDVAALPSENAKIFIKMGIAERRYAAPREPTLKEMFKGAVLTPYIEAAKVRPLEGEGEELKVYIEEKLAELGLPDEEVSSETKRILEEALKQPNPREYADEQLKVIEKREEAKVEEEEKLKAAREKAERLLGEIRATRGVIPKEEEVKIYSPIVLSPEEDFDKVFDKLHSEGWSVNTAEYMQGNTPEEAVQLQAKSFPSLEFQPVQLPKPTVRHPILTPGKWVAFFRTPRGA